MSVMVRCEVRLRIRVARPMARGRNRLSVGPSSAWPRSDPQLLADQLVVVLRVGDGRLEQLDPGLGGAARGEREDRARLRRRPCRGCGRRPAAPCGRRCARTWPARGPSADRHRPALGRRGGGARAGARASSSAASAWSAACSASRPCGALGLGASARFGGLLRPSAASASRRRLVAAALFGRGRLLRPRRGFSAARFFAWRRPAASTSAASSSSASLVLGILVGAVIAPCPCESWPR